MGVLSLNFHCDIPIVEEYILVLMFDVWCFGMLTTTVLLPLITLREFSIFEYEGNIFGPLRKSMSIQCIDLVVLAFGINKYQLLSPY